MATSTPGKHASATVGATPPVSTPFSASHLTAFSPRGGKSVVPSPQQIKKSPATSHTVYGHPSTSSFGGMNFDSPSTAAALGALPGLGDVSLEGAGTLGVPGLHGVGRGDEDEQKRRLAQVVDLLKVNKGHISEQGLERLSKRVGMESLWEPKVGAAGNTGTLIIAGAAVALDIDLEDDVVTRVTLSFPEASKFVSSHADKASQILLRDLQFGPGESQLTKTLDRFADNLERLAALDKLSVMPGLNCHEAVSGIFESLRKLYDWEVAELRTNPFANGEQISSIDNYVVCKKSGRPAMHLRDQVGMSLEYWNDAMVKRQRTGSNSEVKAQDHSWTIVIECAQLSEVVPFPPIRVSDKWISPNIRKENLPAEEMLLVPEGPILDWQEPENTILPNDSAKSDGNAMEGVEQALSASKLPEVMFVARFIPPVVVPYSVAASIYSSTGAPLDTFAASTYDALLLPPSIEEKVDAGEPRIIQRQMTVRDREGGKFVEKQLRCNLLVEKLDYGRSISELPFSHPRQLVEMLPTLRQWAFVSRVLQSCFEPESLPSKSKKAVPVDSGNFSATNKKDSFAAFMSQSIGSTSSIDTSFSIAALSMDVSISTQPAPRLQVTFPLHSSTASVIFEIRANGSVAVVSQNIIPEDGPGTVRTGKLKTSADLAKLLELCEDLALFVTYVRGNT